MEPKFTIEVGFRKKSFYKKNTFSINNYEFSFIDFLKKRFIYFIIVDINKPSFVNSSKFRHVPN